MSFCPIADQWLSLPAWDYFIFMFYSKQSSKMHHFWTQEHETVI